MSGRLCWPEDQLFLSETQLSDRAAHCERPFRELLAEMRIEADLGGYLRSLYVPLAAWLTRRRQQQTPALVIGRISKLVGSIRVFAHENCSLLRPSRNVSARSSRTSVRSAEL